MYEPDNRANMHNKTWRRENLMPSGRKFGNDNYRRFSGRTRTANVIQSRKGIQSRKIKPPNFQHPTSSSAAEASATVAGSTSAGLHSYGASHHHNTDETIVSNSNTLPMILPLLPRAGASHRRQKPAQLPMWKWL
eukprot:4169560-Pleurochrysis_carterae.AAC.1